MDDNIINGQINTRFLKLVEDKQAKNDIANINMNELMAQAKNDVKEQVLSLLQLSFFI